MDSPFSLSCILTLLLIVLISFINATLVHRKFEYKYSFKPPYLAQKDGSVPFWEYGGNAIASSENVRVAPSLRSQKGAIWTKQPLNFEWWEVDIAFRITGRGRIGADGLAFWYTQSKGAYDGEVFGSSDQWVGLGLFFDSFDNDNKHNNPYIMAIVNDGTKQFDHQNDGSTQQLSGCLRDFRNKPFPTRARIEYYQNTLTVLFHNGMTNNDKDYEVCLRAENVFLPKNGYFGLSAATGGLADDHDVIHFLTNSLHGTGTGQTMDGNQITDEEEQKINKQYEAYQKQLERKQASFRKEHPEQNKQPEMDEWFESDNQRELRQIFEGQNQVYEVVKELNRKLDEVVGRQERTMSLITQNAVVQGNIPPPPQGQAQAPGSYSESIRRHEVDAVFNNQKHLMTTTTEIKEYISDIKRRVDTIINNQARQPTAQVQSVGYDTQSLVSEMRDGLNQVKQSFAQFAQQTGQSQNCPNVSCVSITTLLVVIATHLLIVLGYNIYRDSKENNAKKFY